MSKWTFSVALFVCAAPATEDWEMRVANTFANFGFQDLRRRDGGSPTAGLEQVWIASSDVTPIFNGDLVGDLVQPVVTGAFASYVTQASSGFVAANVAYRGIFRGCEFYNPTVGRIMWSNYWPGAGVAGTSSQAGDIKAYISADDEFMFIAQVASGGLNAIINSSQIGGNIGCTSPASAFGNTTTGYSGIGLSTITSLASAPFRLIDFYSNYAPPGGFVNGTDNTTIGQIMVLQVNGWTTKTTTGTSI